MFLSKVFFYVEWNTSLSDSQSTIGYIFILGDTAIFWKLKKRTIIVNSTMEVDVIALP